MPLVVHELGQREYTATLALQEELVARKYAGDRDDHLIFVEHAPVYTLGRGADIADLMGADTRLGVPSHRVGRGGGVTFHGPGQVVAYPIITLPKAGRDVHRYVRQLEDVLIGVCDQFGVVGTRQAGNAGVWVENRKIASIGVGVRRWTTYHGIALNVSTDLQYFEAIVTCRLPDVQMTSLERELGVAPPMADVRQAIEDHFRSVFGFVAAFPYAIEGANA